MALTILLYYRGTGDSARRFAAEMVSSGTVARIRAESGNLQYDYFFPMDDAETVLLIDRWENQEALDRHHASPMMAEIARLRESYDLHMTVQKFASIDDTGSGDAAFIRT